MKIVAVVLASVLAFATCTPLGDFEDGYGALYGGLSLGYGPRQFGALGYGRLLSPGYGGIMGGGIGFRRRRFFRGGLGYGLGYGLGLRRRLFGVPFFSGYSQMIPYGYSRRYGIRSYGSKFGGKYY